MSRKWTAADMPNQEGRLAVVTGANSGIGFEAAVALGRAGAGVILACRSPERGEAALAAAQEEVPEGRFSLARLDLGSLDSVRAFAVSMHQERQRLDLLINNAGLMALPYGRTDDGFETQMGVNHFGHFALTGLLLDLLLATPGSRVVTVSSAAHRMGAIDFDDLDHAQRYERWAAYGQSKLANLLFAFELQRRLAAHDTATISVACHPGYAATELQTKGPKMENAGLRTRFMQLGNMLFGQSAAMGALPTLYAATHPDLSGAEFVGPGFLSVRGYPKLEAPRATALDVDVARRLWDVSVERTGVDYAALAD